MSVSPQLTWSGATGNATSWDLITAAGSSAIGSDNSITNVTSFRTSFAPGTGTITNYYGMYLQALTSGTVSNTYAIVSEAGAGNYGFGTTTPDPSAMLDLSSTTLGFLPTRMNTTQKTSIVSPATGLIVYDTTLNKLCVWTGAAWETITSV